MTLEAIGLGSTGQHLLLPVSILLAPDANSEASSEELSSNVQAELLDLDAWAGILTAYARTMKVAVALTDADGHVLGKCHNPQRVWTLVHDAAQDWVGCPFCINKDIPCTAVREALQRGTVVRVFDQAGLTHVAVPLLLGRRKLGTILAGQVFDRYPDPLPLRRVARDFGVSAQELWDIARTERPVSIAVLQASADLLFALGEAFLRQRYGAILEASLAETNGHFRLLVDGVRDHALFTIDSLGLVNSWNVGAERMFGYNASIVGQSFSCIFTPEDIQNRVPAKQLGKARQAGRNEDEGWRIRADGQQFWAEVNITLLTDDAGPAGGFAIIAQDVTERRKLLTVVEEARQERARTQEKLLSHVSHELRTPLTAIYLFTTNVLDGLLGDLNPEQREHLALAVENVKQLKSMVNDLLDITRVETNKVTVEPQQVFLAKLISDVLTTCQTNATMKNISLISEVDPSVPMVWADPVRLRQVLTNLIDNGIKFSPKTGTVTVTSRPDADDVGFVIISVSDTGCGITPEHCEIVFERLAQVQSTSQASRSGLGLGLFIARDIVSRQGGRIWVESELEKGSTFFFTVPAFSLTKLCSHIFTAPNLQSGFVTLIAVDVASMDNLGDHENVIPEIRRVLEHCIHPAQDILLPGMSNLGTTSTFFIVACADANGSAVIAKRIGCELQKFDNVSQLKPTISSTTLIISSGKSTVVQIGGVMGKLERLIQEHRVNGANSNVTQENSDYR
jgi:PAS domain S-box-containing protein